MGNASREASRDVAIDQRDLFLRIVIFFTI
jgi:hypothetical protein